MRSAFIAVAVLLWAGSWASAQPAGDAAPPPGFGAVNYAVLIGYLAVLVAMGVYFSRRERSTDDYFLAGRRIPWWAAGLSIFGGGLSALTYMAVPALAFAGDWVMILAYIVPVALIPIVTAFFIPFYRRLRVTTAYEYLERRFNLPTRLFASTYFILFQLGRMSIMLFLPAAALSTVTGMDVYACIALMGVLAIAYTVLGGMEAVIWTDVLQVAVLAGGAGLILYTLAARVDFGPAGIVAAGLQHDKFRTFRWGWSCTQGVVWVMVAGSLFSAMMPNTADQSVVQRYLATKDERQARQAAWTSALLGIPTGLVFFFMGTALFAFYKVYKVAELPEDIENIAILPHFVMRQMPGGVSGLVVAGIFAAAMSTVDNGMNAIATAVTTDFYRRLRPGRSERGYLWAARAVTLAAGLVATGTAMVVCSLEIDSMLKFFFRLMNLFGGSLAGLFVLGIFTRRANGWGAMIGAVASAAATYTVKACTPVHFMLHAGIGLGVCVGVGYLASLVVPAAGPREEGLSIHTVSRASGK